MLHWPTLDSLHKIGRGSGGRGWREGGGGKGGEGDGKVKGEEWRKSQRGRRKGV